MQVASTPYDSSVRQRPAGVDTRVRPPWYGARLVGTLPCNHAVLRPLTTLPTQNPDATQSLPGHRGSKHHHMADSKPNRPVRSKAAKCRLWPDRFPKDRGAPSSQKNPTKMADPTGRLSWLVKAPMVPDSTSMAHKPPDEQLFSKMTDKRERRRMSRRIM